MLARSCRISKQLQAFEIKPSYEDVAPSGAASLDEYLQQVHEMTVVAAIKVGHQACADCIQNCLTNLHSLHSMPCSAQLLQVRLLHPVFTPAKISQLLSAEAVM